jgi:hypothetical protein
VELAVHPGTLAVCRLPADAPWPIPPGGEWFYAATRTDSELSVVCPSHLIPPGASVEPDWRALTVAGTLDFSLVGVMASLCGTLAGAGVTVFVLSTFTTDHLLVRAPDLSRATAALRAVGHVVTGGPV